jgi:hypothetical protein
MNKLSYVKKILNFCKRGSYNIINMNTKTIQKCESTQKFDYKYGPKVVTKNIQVTKSC